MSIIQVNRLSKNFGGIKACENITFNVDEGQIFGLIGPNGAGKTTIFNLITGVYKVSGGEILFDNKDISGQRPDRIVKQGISRTFQNIRLFNKLSVLDNVSIAVDLHHKYSLPEGLLRLPSTLKKEAAIKEKAMTFLGAVGLSHLSTARADSLPYGLQRKLEIARALALSPKVLLLDEPAAGMNPEESLELAELIRKLHKQYQITTLLIEHHMDVIMSICEKIFCMNFGEKLAEGTADEIQVNPDVLKAYLGEGYRRVKNIEP